MDVIRAKSAGACYGVQRALDLAHQVLETTDEAYTLGQLIHNPGVVAELESEGAHVVASADDVRQGTVIIRSHGITPEERRKLLDRHVDIADATCPHVARAQKAAAELATHGCHVIVVGESGHPEVEGLTAYVRQAGGTVDVVQGPADIPERLPERVGAVVQTTQRRENLDAILEALAERGVTPEVKNTICYATSQRQDSAASLAATVDAMVVIGGRNSSNTTRLAEICRKHCARTFHIESADELQSSWFDGCQRVGVTAGASTPENQIDAVTDYLSLLP